MESRTKAQVRGRNATQIRAFNQKLILNTIRTEIEISRASIARLTGLSPPAVSAIVGELEEDGYLEQRSRSVSKVGTPSILYGVRRGAAYSVGIHIGRRSTSVVLLDMVGEISRQAEYSYRFPATAETRAFVDATIAGWQTEIPDLEQRLIGTGICSPKFFGYAADELGYPKSVSADWTTFEVKRAFSRLASHPIFEENDANAAALAELEWGNGAEIRNFFYIYIGTLIGGGLVLDGRLIRGPQGLAATFGPFPVGASKLSSARGADIDGEHLYRRSSIFVLLEHLRHGGFLIAQESDLHAPVGAWAPLVAEWTADAAQALAQSVQGIVAIIDVEAIVIDSTMPHSILKPLVGKVEAALRSKSDRMIVMPELVMGKAGPQASARGAAMVPFVEVMGIGNLHRIN